MDILRESSLFQSLTQESREKAREEGLEQGIQESIQEVLEIRFGLNETHPLFARIAAIDNVQHLKQLRRVAIQVSNLDEFGRLLDSTA